MKMKKLIIPMGIISAMLLFAACSETEEVKELDELGNSLSKKLANTEETKELDELGDSLSKKLGNDPSVIADNTCLLTLDNENVVLAKSPSGIFPLFPASWSRFRSAAISKIDLLWHCLMLGTINPRGVSIATPMLWSPW